MKTLAQGKPYVVKWEYAGTLTASTAPVLYVNGSSSVITVSWDTSVAGIAKASVVTTSLALADVIEYRAGSLTYGGPAYAIESEQHVIDVLANTRSATGAQMDLVNAPNATAITAIQSGLSKPGTAQTITPADTAAAGTAQTSIATLLTRVPSTVHTASQQTADLTTIASWITSVPGFVWTHTANARSLTTFGTLVADVVAGVWGAAIRKITGGALDVAPPTASQITGAITSLPAWATWHTATQQTQDVMQTTGLLGDVIAAINTRSSQTSVNTLATTVGTLSTLNAAGVRAALGLSTANLDVQLSGISLKADQAIDAADAATQAAMDAETAADGASAAVGSLGAATGAIGGNIGELLAMTTGTGANRKFTVVAVSNVSGGGGGGGGGTIAGPVFASLPLGVDLRVSTKLIVTQHGACRLPIEVFGVDRTPVALAGLTLRFVIFDDNGIKRGQVDADRIAVDDETPNRCYVDLLPAETNAFGQRRWTLWDRTNAAEPRSLGKGPFVVELAAIGDD